jgi:proteic killer suppression protein
MSPPCAGFLLRQTVKLRSFRHKGLSDSYRSGKAAKIRPDLQGRVLRRLDALDAARDLSNLNVPGFDFHSLRGFKPTRYSLHVNGPWCITFEWMDGDAIRVDLEQYH